MQSGLFIVNCNIPATWDCISGLCSNNNNGTGTYNSLNDCELNCNLSSWNCNNGICEDPGDGTGMYASQNCCEAECVATNLYEEKKITNIFPNPVTDHLIIYNNKLSIFTLYDLSGRIAFLGDVHPDEKIREFGNEADSEIQNFALQIFNDPDIYKKFNEIQDEDF